MADDELAVFQAELASIDGAGDAPADGSASPEEKRFEDDDGTVYVWDPGTRKFAPEGEDVPAPAAGAAPAAPAPAPPPASSRTRASRPTSKTLTPSSSTSICTWAGSRPTTTGLS